MKRTFLLAVLAFLSLLFAAPPLRADIVHLKNGGKIEGIVTAKGDSYVIRHRYGTVTVKKADVASIEKKETLLEKYEKKRAAIDPKDPDAHVALGRWLDDHGWKQKAKEEYEAALALDPDHRAAHLALGHVYYEGAWRTEDEIMKRKGFVKVGDKWVTKEEKERLAARKLRKEMAEERRKELRALELRMRKDLRLIAYGTARECEKGYDDLVTVARAHDNKQLEKFAGDVKAYFDSYWQLVKRQNAVTEIRATVATLKRPIRTFTTSLGAGSSPVTHQLPELTVWSVKTTVPVPAGR